MKSFFNLPHVFVVFYPGSSGNLISNLIDNLVNQNLSSVNVANAGHVHNNSIVDRKLQGTDYLSMGSGFGSEDVFKSPAEKLEFYKNKIENADYEQDRRYVTWTHDFENIPLYKSLFPNARIIAIDSCTFGERLTAMIMNINKNFFSENKKLTFTDDEIRYIERGLRAIIIFATKKYYGIDLAQAGFSIRQYPEFMKHLMYKFYYDIQGFNSYSSINDRVPNISPRLRYQNHSMVLADSNPHNYDDCITIKFSDILNSPKNILSGIELAVARTLMSSEQEYIVSSLYRYREMQDSKIISDPIAYLNDYQRMACEIIASLDK